MIWSYDPQLDLAIQSILCLFLFIAKSRDQLFELQENSYGT